MPVDPTQFGLAALSAQQRTVDRPSILENIRARRLEDEKMALMEREIAAKEMAARTDKMKEQAKIDEGNQLRSLLQSLPPLPEGASLDQRMEHARRAGELLMYSGYTQEAERIFGKLSSYQTERELGLKEVSTAAEAASDYATAAMAPSRIALNEANAGLAGATVDMMRGTGNRGYEPIKVDQAQVISAQKWLDKQTPWWKIWGNDLDIASQQFADTAELFRRTAQAKGQTITPEQAYEAVKTYVQTGAQPPYMMQQSPMALPPQTGGTPSGWE